MKTDFLADIGVTKQPPNGGIQVEGQKSGDLVESLVKNTIILFFTVGAVAVLIMVLWGSVEWIFSEGDKEKIAGARKRITTAIIGAFLLSLTFVIVGIVSQISGFNILGTLNIPFLGD